MSDFIPSVLVDEDGCLPLLCRHKFLNTLKNIDIEINVLLLFFLNNFWVAFHCYSKGIFSIDLVRFN